MTNVADAGGMWVKGISDGALERAEHRTVAGLLATTRPFATAILFDVNLTAATRPARAWMVHRRLARDPAATFPPVASLSAAVLPPPVLAQQRPAVEGTSRPRCVSE